MRFKTSVKLYGSEDLLTFESPGRLSTEIDGDFINLKTIAGAVYLIFNVRELQYIKLNEDI